MVLDVDTVIKYHSILTHGKAELLPGGRKLIESALSVPEASFDGFLVYKSLESQTACLLNALLAIHPFSDGNKRIAWVATEVFVRSKGYRVALSDEDVKSLVYDIVQGYVSCSSLVQTFKTSIV